MVVAVVAQAHEKIMVKKELLLCFVCVLVCVHNFIQHICDVINEWQQQQQQNQNLNLLFYSGISFVAVNL